VGSRDLFTLNPYDLGIPEDVLMPTGQPDGLYSVLAGRMARMETGQTAWRFGKGW